MITVFKFLHHSHWSKEHQSCLDLEAGLGVGGDGVEATVEEGQAATLSQEE